MTLRLLSVCLALFASLGPTKASAQSLGHFHLPSTLPQFCGLGYGAGHHAPMIRPIDCHPPRMQRYVHVPGCSACGALPMESFPMCSGPGCHSQLDQLMGAGEYDPSEVTPTPVQAPSVEESQLPPPEMPPATPEMPQASADVNQSPQFQMFPAL